jgi:subtilisin family serine protease
MRSSTRLQYIFLVVALVACSDGTGPTPGGSNSGALTGDPTSPAAAAIPRLPYVARAEDFSTTHPELTGVPISFNTIALVFQPTTTVAQANDLIEGFSATVVGGIPGKAGVTSGILFLRLPTKTHPEMIARLAELRADSRVFNVVQDALLQPTVVPDNPAAHDSLVNWTWEVTPSGGNWGLETIRTPQMWALNEGISKAGLQRPSTLVFDNGFDASHADLAYANASSKVESHGTHVTGTIGAKFNNGVGVDGVNPFARLTIKAFVSWGEVISEVEAVIRADPNVRVINTSLAYNWINGNASPVNFSAGVTNPQKILAFLQGGLIFLMLKDLDSDNIRLPVWVTAAGNDSNSPFGDQSAVWASPIANAAIEHGAKNIIVVEAVNKAIPGQNGNPRAAFSNLNGHLSAPGVGILSTDSMPVAYARKSGTSMASPHVAGLVGYLYALDPTLASPTLTTNPILDLLLANAVPAQGGAKPVIDAFATALDVDRVQNNTRVLKMLVDIDDGTDDGNQRTNIDNSAFTADNHGDGKVNMRDFRRWRDWAVEVHFWDEESLDGATQHPKKDLNGNDSVGSDVDENIYPRGDFNGDGRLDIANTRSKVTGVINRTVTDLEVLQELFADSNYTKSDLPNLIRSGDLHFDAGGCLSGSGVVGVRSAVHPQGSTAFVQPTRLHSTAAPSQIYTVPVDVSNGTRFTLKMEALNAAGTVIDSAKKDTLLRLAADIRYKPACSGPAINITVSPATASVSPGQTQQFTATVTGTSNTQVVWTTNQTGGSISGSGLLTAGQTTGTFEVRATSVADNTKSATAQVTVTGSFEVGDIYVGTRQFNGAGTPFPVALIFSRQKDRLIQCVSPLSSNQPNEYRRICATVGGEFTDHSGYILLSVTFSGNTITGEAIGGDGGATSTTKISLTLDGNKLTGRLTSPPNLFTTYDTTKR